MKYLFVIIVLCIYYSLIFAAQIPNFPPLPSHVVQNPEKGLRIELDRRALKYSDSVYQNLQNGLEPIYVPNQGLQGNWASCVNETDPAKCPIAGSLEGITTFQIRIPQLEYRLVYGPEIVTENEVVGSPLIRNEQGDKWYYESEVDQEGSGYFYVDYNCSASGNMRLSMFLLIETLTETNMPLPLDIHNNLSAAVDFLNSTRSPVYLLLFQWYKVCKADEIRPGIEVGYIKEFIPSEPLSQEEVLEQKAVLYPKPLPGSSSQLETVSVTESSTDLYVSCMNGSQLFRPEITADCISEMDKCVSLRGIGSSQLLFGELLAEEGETYRFTVFYSCEKARSEGIIHPKLVLNFPPFQPVKLEWRKDCGGMLASSISVGTTWHGSDIINQGRTMEAFGLSPSYTIDEETRDLEIFVSTSYQDVISLEKVVVTVEKPRVVSVRVNPNNPISLSSVKTASLQLHFVCLNDGESLVVITLSFLYRPLEFSLVKKCRKPQLRRAQGFTVYHADRKSVV